MDRLTTCLFVLFFVFLNLLPLQRKMYLNVLHQKEITDKTAFITLIHVFVMCYSIFIHPSLLAITELFSGVDFYLLFLVTGIASVV